MADQSLVHKLLHTDSVMFITDNLQMKCICCCMELMIRLERANNKLLVSARGKVSDNDFEVFLLSFYRV